MTYEMTIAALENPPQRAIFAALQAGALPFVTLAQSLPVSRPAVTQHLRVLTTAGLLIVTCQKGIANPVPLSPDEAFELIWIHGGQKTHMPQAEISSLKLQRTRMVRLSKRLPVAAASCGAYYRLAPCPWVLLRC
jgi:DNA-binding transcriptional ArsR family regulator